MTRKEYRDADGVWRRVLLPDDEAAPEEGIPLGIDLDAWCEAQGVGKGFRVTLYNELWVRGVIEPAQIADPRNAELVRAAYLATVKLDIHTLQQIAKEQIPHVAGQK